MKVKPNTGLDEQKHGQEHTSDSGLLQRDRSAEHDTWISNEEGPLQVLEK